MAEVAKMVRTKKQVHTTFVSAEQAAEESGYSLRHIRRLVFDTGEFAIVKFNKRRHMLLRRDFEKWLKKQHTN